MFTSEEIMEVMKLDGMKHRVIPFHARHMHMANFRSFEQDLIDGYGRPHIQDYGVEGLSFTGIRNGKIVVIWGLYPLWKGVAEAWMLPSADLVNKKMVIYRPQTILLCLIFDTRSPSWK